MKTLNTFVLAFALITSGFAFASEKPAKKEKKEKVTIYRVVADYLSSPEVDLTSDQEAIVQFSINENNRIEVQAVETTDVRLERAIKNRLNFEKIDAAVIGSKNEFRIKLKFTDKFD